MWYNNTEVIIITTTIMQHLSMPNTKIITMDFHQNFIKAFQIFKNDKTSDWVTILIAKSDYSEEFVKNKKEFYTHLGYSIK